LCCAAPRVAGMTNNLVILYLFIFTRLRWPQCSQR
jgi:hypothetical protein